jgi:hypothetical protein
MSRATNALRIDIDKEIGERITRRGGSLPAIMDFSMGDVAQDMAVYIRESFLDGNALEKRTGKTFASVRHYNAKKGIAGHYVDFGVAVKGHLNYLHRWTGTDREFMGPGKAGYESTGRYMDLVEENLERMERKLEVL